VQLMQKRERKTRARFVAVNSLGAFAAFFTVQTAGFRVANAETISVDTAHALYHESPTGSKMTVYTPSLNVKATPASWFDIKAGYEADVVSGASVAVKAGPAYQATHPGADVVTSASVRDYRHKAAGGVRLSKDDVDVNLGGSYSTENDYKSRTLNIAVRTDAYEHNTQFELSYARSFDLSCDRIQSTTDGFALFRALEDASGCFTSAQDRRTRDLVSDSFQGSYTQSWTPALMTQVVYTAQILNGFQSNPYRSVIVGEGLKAQEHHPDLRSRHALTLRLNWYLAPIKSVLRFGVRAYADSWAMKSITGDLEIERYVAERVRFALHGRFYKQSGAVFWSDDYSGGDPPLGPRGQYFSGDRELSPFMSAVVGTRLAYLHEAKPDAKMLGFISSVKLSANLDVMQFFYQDYTLGGVSIGNARALLGVLSLGASF
jgi:hypothetical protein